MPKQENSEVDQGLCAYDKMLQYQRNRRLSRQWQQFEGVNAVQVRFICNALHPLIIVGSSIRPQARCLHCNHPPEKKFERLNHYINYTVSWLDHACNTTTVNALVAYPERTRP